MRIDDGGLKQAIRLQKAQTETGPGMMGKKLAATPNSISRPPKISNMMSME